MRRKRREGSSPFGAWSGFDLLAFGAVPLFARPARAEHEDSVAIFAAEAAALTIAVDDHAAARVRAHEASHHDARDEARRSRILRPERCGAALESSSHDAICIGVGVLNRC